MTRQRKIRVRDGHRLQFESLENRCVLSTLGLGTELGVALPVLKIDAVVNVATEPLHTAHVDLKLEREAAPPVQTSALLNASQLSFLASAQVALQTTASLPVAVSVQTASAPAHATIEISLKLPVVAASVDLTTSLGQQRPVQPAPAPVSVGVTSGVSTAASSTPVAVGVTSPVGVSTAPSPTPVTVGAASSVGVSTAPSSPPITVGVTPTGSVSTPLAPVVKIGSVGSTLGDPGVTTPASQPATSPSTVPAILTQTASSSPSPTVIVLRSTAATPAPVQQVAGNSAAPVAIAAAPSAVANPSVLVPATLSAPAATGGPGPELPIQLAAAQETIAAPLASSVSPVTPPAIGGVTQEPLVPSLSVPAGALAVASDLGFGAGDEAAEETPLNGALPESEACDVVAVASPFRALQLGQALEQFLGQVGELDQSLRQRGAWPWFCVGLAAAAVSSELTRRVQQARRARAGDAGDECLAEGFPGLCGPSE